MKCDCKNASIFKIYILSEVGLGKLWPDNQKKLQAKEAGVMALGGGYVCESYIS